MLTSADRRFPLPAFLRRELALRPGRIAAIGRITISCTLVAIIWMVFQIPEPAYAIYIVFLVSGTDAGVSFMTGVAGLLAATLAIALSIALYTIDAAEPAIRIPVMALTTFLGMYLSRTIAVGPVAFLLGFILVITQTIADVLPKPEALTHFLLWLWIVVAVPAVMTVTVNLWFGAHPAKLLREAAVALLDNVARSFQGHAWIPAPSGLSPATTLVGLHKRASILERRLRVTQELDTDIIETLNALSMLASAIPVHLPSAVLSPIYAACTVCRDAIANKVKPAPCSPWPTREALEALDYTARPVVVAVSTLLKRLHDDLTRRAAPSEASGDSRSAPEPLFIADAFTNPDHVRFALKATFAAMITYTLYTGLDWPGIRTCLITCFFVALGSVGETVHKLSLRLAGALIGGLLGGLCIVYVIPHMTDAGDLVLLVSAASILCAWVSTSSELLAYAGMQMALAFFMGVLQGYGPATDLTVLRDRVIGIVLGNLVMSVVFSVVWPVSARTQARRKLAGVLRSLSLVLAPHGQQSAIGTQIQVSTAIDHAKQLLAISTFEAPLVPTGTPRSAERQVIDDAEEIVRATLVLVNQPAAVRIEGQGNSQAVAAFLSHRLVPWIEAGAGEAPTISPSHFHENAESGASVTRGSAFEAEAAVRRTISTFVDHAAILR